MQSTITEQSKLPLDIIEKSFTPKNKVDKIRAAIYKGGYKDQHLLPIDQLRQKYARKKHQLKCGTQDLRLPLPDGDVITLRYYFNSCHCENIIIFIHGGGFIFGGLDESDQLCERILNNTDADIIAIDYRLAPDFKFPTAYNDVIFATKHIIDNFTHTKNIFVLGESSGGNLATQVADIYRENIAGQILLYPSVDYYSPYNSKIKFKEDYLLDQHIRNWVVIQ